MHSIRILGMSRRDSLRAVLKAAGHRVLAHGEKGRADLVIAETGSAETSEYLSEMGDSVPVLFVSSVSIDGLVKMEACESGAWYATVHPLNLPLTPANLLASVARALHAAAPPAESPARRPAASAWVLLADRFGV